MGQVPVDTKSRNVKRYVRLALKAENLHRLHSIAVDECNAALDRLTGGQVAEARRILEATPEWHK